MAIVFFDTSALIRRYGTRESGSEDVRALCLGSEGHVLVIAAFTRVEVASALSRQVREGLLNPRQRAHRWGLFRRHAREEYRTIALDEAAYGHAERLLFEHALRAGETPCRSRRL